MIYIIGKLYIQYYPIIIIPVIVIPIVPIYTILTAPKPRWDQRQQITLPLVVQKKVQTDTNLAASCSIPVPRCITESPLQDSNHQQSSAIISNHQQSATSRQMMAFPWLLSRCSKYFFTRKHQRSRPRRPGPGPPPPLDP